MDDNMEHEQTSTGYISMKRIHGLLDLRLENEKDTLEALKELSTFFPDNTLENRKSLRCVIEKKTLNINNEFLSSLELAHTTLDDMHYDVLVMNSTVNQMKSRLSSTKAQTRSLIDQTTKLQKEVMDATSKQEIASGFIQNLKLCSELGNLALPAAPAGRIVDYIYCTAVLNTLDPLQSFSLPIIDLAYFRLSRHMERSKGLPPTERFQLSQSEMSALRSETLCPEMFSALEKTEMIMDSCRILAQAGYQTAAQDIADQMTLNQEAGMKRLLRWTQSRCRSMDLPDPNSMLPRAMATLQHRPVLFQQVLEEYTMNRRNVLVKQFIDALTSGGRPIELRATEPKRYIGDMLAWLHQAVPAERDYISFLLRNCDVLDIQEFVAQTLSCITEGVCHPFKVRIEYVLLAENNAKDCLLLQGVLHLLSYYKKMIFQIVGGGQLDSTLCDAIEIAEKTFLLSLQNRVSQLLECESESPSSDLLPTPSVCKALVLLEQILTSEGSGQDMQRHMNQAVSLVLDPLLMRLTESAAGMAAVDMSVYLLNNFHLIETKLALYPFLDERLERLKAQSDAQMDTLTSEQASRLVAQLGLGPIYTVLQGQPQHPFSQVSGMDSINVSSFAGKLEKLLKAPDLFQMPQLALLTSTNQRLGVQRRAGAVIASVYRDLHAAVHDPRHLYQNPSQLLPTSPEIVAQIWPIIGT